MTGRRTFFVFFLFFEERNQSSKAAEGFHPTQQLLSELFKCFSLAIDVFYSFVFWTGGGTMGG